MKYFKFLILLFPGVLLIMCTPKQKTTEVEIRYEFSDDVSPVNGVLKINETVHYAEWIINDTTVYTTPGKNNVELVFEKEGLSTVELKATNANGDGYYGKTQIDIPPIANKLQIKGFYFEKDLNYNFQSDSVGIEFQYFNSSTYTEFYKQFKKSLFDYQDTILFNEPIVLDIEGFDNVNEKYNYWVYIYLKDKDQNGQNTYFKTNFTLTEAYFHYRLVNSQDKITEWDIFLSENRNAITLLVDWLR